MKYPKESINSQIIKKFQQNSLYIKSIYENYAVTYV